MLATADSPQSTGWIVAAALVCCVVLLVVALKVIKPVMSFGSAALSIFH